VEREIAFVLPLEHAPCADNPVRGIQALPCALAAVTSAASFRGEARVEAVWTEVAQPTVLVERVLSDVLERSARMSAESRPQDDQTNMNATRAGGPWTDCHVRVAAEVLDNGLLVRLEISLTFRDRALDEWRCMDGTG
jgi:hypothetical protein